MFWPSKVAEVDYFLRFTHAHSLGEGKREEGRGGRREFLQCPLNLLKTGNPKQFHLPTYTSLFVLRVSHIKIHRLVDLTRNFFIKQFLQLKDQEEGVARFDFSRGCLA